MTFSASISGLVALCTDFGWEGTYVGELKGTLLRLAPRAVVVDFCHTIPPHDIRAGAFAIPSALAAFPEGTIHLAIVDPGVGTDRRILAARARGQWIIGPDNGLMSLAMDDPDFRAVAVEVANLKIRGPRVSSTFHGRDQMAPAAAHLLLGGDPEDLGPLVLDPIRRDFASRSQGEGDRAIFDAEIVSVDRFGNLITNLASDRLDGTDWIVTIGDRTIGGLSRTYGDHHAGALVALAGSSGWLEVARVTGSAAAVLGAGVGVPIRVMKGKSD